MGRPRSGKDHVADLTGLAKYPLGGPLYDLVKYFFPTAEKHTPGFIDLLKKFGQWGRACYTDDYPLTMERALMTERVREIGPRLGEGNPWCIEWYRYGRSTTLWAQGAVQRYQKANWRAE